MSRIRHSTIPGEWATKRDILGAIELNRLAVAQQRANPADEALAARMALKRFLKMHQRGSIQ